MFKITSVKTQKLESENSKLLGTARIVLDNCFVIGDLRIIQGKNERGMFVAFPSRKQKDGKFYDICHPLNAKTRKYFEDIILAEFIANGTDQKASSKDSNE